MPANRLEPREIKEQGADLPVRMVNVCRRVYGLAGANYGASLASRMQCLEPSGERRIKPITPDLFRRLIPDPRLPPGRRLHRFRRSLNLARERPSPRRFRLLRLRNEQVLLHKQE